MPDYSKKILCPGCGEMVPTHKKCFVPHDNNHRGLCCWSKSRVPRPLRPEDDDETSVPVARNGEPRPFRESLAERQKLVSTRFRLDQLAQSSKLTTRRYAISELKKLDADEERARNKHVLCHGKRSYATEAKAEEVAADTTRWNLFIVREEGRTGARSYVCPDCKQWHVSSSAARGK